MPRTFNFKELSLREQANTTYEELKTIFLPFLLMERGVVRVPEPTPLPMPEMPTYTSRTVYELLRGSEHTGIFFDTPNALEGFTALKPGTCTEDWYIGHYGGIQVRGFDPDKKPYGICPVDMVDAPKMKELSRWAQDINSVKTANEKAQKEYTEANAEAREAMESLEDLWRTAQAKASKFADVISTRASYLAMANGDEEVAMNFLRKAFSTDVIEAALEYEAETRKA